MIETGEDKKSSDYAETWIRIVTVFLAIQLASITFILSNPSMTENIPNFIAAVYFAIGMLIPMLASLCLFILARDPRQARLSTFKLIDAGVACVAAGVVITSVAGGLSTFMITTDAGVSITVTSGTIGTMLVFYPFAYYRMRRMTHSAKKV